MPSQLEIAPEGQTGGGGTGGGGPEDDHRSPQAFLRTQGLLALAFGFALALALVIFFWLIRAFPPTAEVGNFFRQFNLWFIFLFGLIVGTIMSGVYNLLVVRRLNLFGLESSAD
jgi:hypothetical protein